MIVLAGVVSYSRFVIKVLLSLTISSGIESKTVYYDASESCEMISSGPPLTLPLLPRSISFGCFCK